MAVERLRRFILDLTIRGKLVSQDPNDEPASELLKRVGAERDLKSQKAVTSLLPPSPDSPYAPLPSSWAYAPLSAIADVVMGQSPPGDTYNKSGEGVPLINGPVEFSPGHFGKTVVNQYTTAPTKFCEEGDLLICVRGSTTGRTNIAAFRACIGRGVAAIQPFFDDSYIRLFIWKSRADIIDMGRGIAFPSISKKQIEDLVLPLPPLGEQQRIASQVDDLMTICDQLEVTLSDAEVTRTRLLEALIANTLTPCGDADVENKQMAIITP
jgi:type I restriction enzyme S subunit